jgi:hypothetical protein
MGILGFQLSSFQPGWRSLHGSVTGCTIGRE